MFMEEIIQTGGGIDLVNITPVIERFTRKEGGDGIVLVFTPHATAGVVALENEEGLINDFKDTLNALIPQDKTYSHNRIDDNAHSHLRATLLGPELLIPVTNGVPELGTWQQIFLADLDTKPRKRRILLRMLR